MSWAFTFQLAFLAILLFVLAILGILLTREPAPTPGGLVGDTGPRGPAGPPGPVGPTGMAGRCEGICCIGTGR